MGVLDDTAETEVHDNNENVTTDSNVPVGHKATLRFNRAKNKNAEAWAYCVELNGHIYALNATRNLELCNGKLPDKAVLPEEAPLDFHVVPGKLINLAELQRAAENKIAELKQTASQHKTKTPFFSANQSLRIGQGFAAGSDAIHVKENAEYRIHILLGIHKDAVNADLRELNYKLDTTDFTLVKNNGHKVIVNADGSTRAELFKDLADKNIVQKLVDDLLAVVIMLQTLHRDTGGMYPTEINDLFIIRQGLSAEQQKTVTEVINPEVKRIVKERLATKAFENIRAMLSYDGEPIVEQKHVEKKQEEKKHEDQQTEQQQNPQQDQQQDQQQDLGLNTALFCIDFDNTIASQHTHNIIANAEQEHGRLSHEDQWQLVKDIPPIGSDQQWQELFKTLYKDGHRIAIVSFGQYEHIIARYLKEIIGLKESFIKDHLKIVSYLPEDPSNANKEDHMSQANEEPKLPAENIVLVDDSRRNTRHAAVMGHQIIYADESGKHIKETLELSKKIKEQGVRSHKSINTLSSSAASMSFGRN